MLIVTLWKRISLCIYWGKEAGYSSTKIGSCPPYAFRSLYFGCWEALGGRRREDGGARRGWECWSAMGLGLEGSSEAHLVSQVSCKEDMQYTGWEHARTTGGS